MPWIQLNDGTKIDYGKPEFLTENWGTIFVAAVASIAQQVRFQGHTYPCLTVAEHSMVAAAIKPEIVGIDPEDKVAVVEYPIRALLHDVSEAFFSDIPGPAKLHMYWKVGKKYAPLREFMGRFDDAIGKAFELAPPLITEAVGRGDKIATAVEGVAGLSEITDKWTDGYFDERVVIPPRFLDRKSRTVTDIMAEYFLAFQGYKADMTLARRQEKLEGDQK